MRRLFTACLPSLLLALLFYFIPARLHSRPKPLPDAVAHAHTVFLENETGFNELQYTLVLELSRWGRFDLVDAREKADLVIRLDNGNHVRSVPDGQLSSSPGVNAFAEGEVPKGHTRIALLDPKSNSVLWSETHRTEGGKVKNGHLLDGLREAFDAYDKSRH